MCADRKDHDELCITGVSRIELDSRKIWTPNFYLPDSFDFRPNEIMPPLIVSPTGDVEFYPTMLCSTACTIDPFWFPYDEQLCEVKLVSWMHQSSSLVFKAITETADIEAMVENSHWYIKGWLVS